MQLMLDILKISIMWFKKITLYTILVGLVVNICSKIIEQVETTSELYCLCFFGFFLIGFIYIYRDTCWKIFTEKNSTCYSLLFFIFGIVNSPPHQCFPDYIIYSDYAKNFDSPSIYKERTGVMTLPILSFDGEKLRLNPVFGEPKYYTWILGAEHLRYVIESPGLGLAWYRLENYCSRRVARTFWYYPLVDVLQVFDVVWWTDYPLTIAFLLGAFGFVVRLLTTGEDPFSVGKIVTRREWQKIWNYESIDENATWETLSCVRENPEFAEKVAKHLNKNLKIRDFDGSYFREVTPDGNWFSLNPQTGDHICSLLPHQPYSANPELFVLWEKLCPEMTIRFFIYQADAGSLDLIAENLGIWYWPIANPIF